MPAPQRHGFSVGDVIANKYESESNRYLVRETLADEERIVVHRLPLARNVPIEVAAMNFRQLSAEEERDG